MQPVEQPHSQMSSGRAAGQIWYQQCPAITKGKYQGGNGIVIGMNLREPHMNV